MKSVTVCKMTRQSDSAKKWFALPPPSAAIKPSTMTKGLSEPSCHLPPLGTVMGILESTLSAQSRNTCSTTVCRRL